MLMGKVFSDLSVSADGFATGVGQREDAPFGDIDETWLHGWMFEAGEENRAEVDAIIDSGATIMGRNMFGPVRGEWNRDWRGWWGTDPPYHNELRLHVTACVLGAGERIFDGVPPQRLERVSVRATSLVTHITYRPLR
jgi:dihydrofolate reductase